METHRSGEVNEQTAALLQLALQLRAAAADAGRQDVAAQVDDLMGMIAGEKVLADSGARRGGAGVAETVQRILNGLGF